MLLMLGAAGLSHGNPVNANTLGGQNAISNNAEDPFLENPRYKYSFNVVDDDEQVYQAHKQAMEDKVSLIKSVPNLFW